MKRAEVNDQNGENKTRRKNSEFTELNGTAGHLFFSFVVVVVVVAINEMQNIDANNGKTSTSP